MTTEACPHQAYLYDNRVMGLQFHMEAIPTLIASMTEHGKEELNAGDWVQSEKEIMGTQEYFAGNNRWIGKLLIEFAGT